MIDRGEWFYNSCLCGCSFILWLSWLQLYFHQTHFYKHIWTSMYHQVGDWLWLSQCLSLLSLSPWWSLEMWSFLRYYAKVIRSQNSLFPSAAAAAKSLQSCLTLCDPIDGSPPGSPIPGILQARVLEWGAIAFSKAWKWKVKVKSLSRLLATSWTAAYQAPTSMGFSRQEYWSGVPLH